MDFQRATSINIYEKLKAMLTEFGITDMENIIFVTDRGANMISALSHCERINCSNHLLNNVLEDAFKNSVSLEQMTQGCKKLVEYLKKSNLQHMLETTLKTHSTTRWLSHYSMFKSIYLNWATITQILQEKEELHRLMSINHELLKQLCALLECFQQSSLKLQGSNYITIHYVHILINFLKNACQQSELDAKEIIILKENILHGINGKWLSNLNIYHQLAVFLYPPTNQLENFDSNTINSIKEFCLEKMKKLNNNNLNTTSPTDVPSNNFDKLIFSKFINEKPNDGNNILYHEISRYSNTSVAYSENFDALKWWETYKMDFPTLYSLSRQILCIPASSASSERAFSLAGNIITEKRNKISPKKVNNLLFLHSTNEF